MYKGICDYKIVENLYYSGRDRKDMINYGKYDEELFQDDDIVHNSPNSHEHNSLSNSRRPTPYIFDADRDSEEENIGCGCIKGLKVICSYMKMSDDCFETFTEKSMALTITLFKFVKVMDEFSAALELLIQSWSRIRNLIL